MRGETQLESEKTRVYAQKPRLKKPFKNSITGDWRVHTRSIQPSDFGQSQRVWILVYKTNCCRKGCSLLHVFRQHVVLQITCTAFEDWNVGVAASTKAEGRKNSPDRRQAQFSCERRTGASHPCFSSRCCSAVSYYVNSSCRFTIFVLQTPNTVITKIKLGRHRPFI
jgi:hypothetical protein